MMEKSPYKRMVIQGQTGTELSATKSCWRKFSSFFVYRALLVFFYFSINGVIAATPVWANNLAITNGSLKDQDTTNDTIVVEFDISWSNSWRDSENWDAAWVFVKYSTDAGANWAHATLSTSGTNPSSFSQGSGTALDIMVPSDKMGCFLRRSSIGSGAVSTTDIRLVWDYGEDGISTDSDVTNSTNTKIRIYAIEMVYVPGGAFYIGDGSDGTEGQFEFEGSAAGLVSPGETIVFESAEGDQNAFYYNTDTTGDDDASGSVFNIAEPFPTGTTAFYLMKYEITQGQYADFLNALTRTEQNNRVATDVSTDIIVNVYVLSNSLTSSNRDNITVPATGNGTTDPVTFTANTADRACNYLTWMDLCSYADWAALRPMSELEFEKSCRGPLFPVNAEYAWLSTTLNGALAGEIDPDSTEDGTETISDADANACYNNVTFSTGDGGTGPLRAGIFAESSTSTRQSSGAGYYGNMELTGNVWERCVTIGNSTGRAFAGSHGDGVLVSTSSYESNATNTDWPGIDSTINRGVTGATGAGFRGAAWDETTTTYLEVSDRSFAGDDDATSRSDSGGRLARTAP